jgi:hypothetical protein
MPCDYSKYPTDWKLIRSAILDRAGHRCEQCRVPNGATIRRCAEIFLFNGTLLKASDGSRIKSTESPLTLGAISREVVIVLTVAHLDHDITNNEPGNLAALCQWHHLRLDAEQHRVSAAATRRRKIEVAGQLTLETKP